MKKNNLLILILLSFYVLISFVYIGRIGGTHAAEFANFLSLLPPLLSVIGGIYLIDTYHISNPHGKSIGLLTLGLLCWFVSEVIYFVYAFLLTVNPYPSVADAFYILGYPLWYAGLLVEIKSSNVHWGTINKFEWTIIFIETVILAFFVCYFGFFVAYNPDATVAENFIKIGYAFGDLFLVLPTVFILKLSLDFREGKLFNPWFCIFLGVFLSLVAHILFAVFTDSYETSIWPSTLIDLLWIASYFLFAYSFFSITFILKDFQQKIIKSSK